MSASRQAAGSLSSSPLNGPEGRRGHGRKVLLALILGLSFAFLNQDLAAQADPGEQLFRTALGCAGCHGQDGGGGVGPKILKTALSFDEFVQRVRAPLAAMPPFGPRIASDEDLQAIYQWLQKEEAKVGARAPAGSFLASAGQDFVRR